MAIVIPVLRQIVIGLLVSMSGWWSPGRQANGVSVP
jgi:hypothetical protein